MSQHEYLFHLEALNGENLRLLQHIDYLEERLSKYEDVPEIEQTTAHTRDEKQETTDDWSVWPYSWATAVWQATNERLHSFHGNLHSARSAKQGGRNQRSYEAHLEEGELALT